MTDDLIVSEDKSNFGLAEHDAIWASILADHPVSDQDDPAFGRVTMPEGIQGFFAREGRETVGYMSVFSDQVSCAWGVDFAVRADRQRQGIGRRLLRAALNQFGHLPFQVHAIKIAGERACESEGVSPIKGVIACAREGVRHSQWPRSAIQALGLRQSLNPAGVASGALSKLLKEGGFLEAADAVARAGTSEALFKTPNSFGHFVFESDELVGFARVNSNRLHWAWLSELVVRPDRRGIGIGRALIAETNNRFLNQCFYAAVPSHLAEMFHRHGVRQQRAVTICGKPPDKSPLSQISASLHQCFDQGH